jgi:cytochrome c1
MAVTPPPKKAGPKKGTVYKAALDRMHWYNLCKRFTDNKLRYASKQTNFLRHSDSGEQVNVTDKARFSTWMKKYLAGHLKAEERGGMQQNRKGLYDKVANKLVHYLDLRAEKFKQDHLGISWSMLKIKAINVRVW